MMTAARIVGSGRALPARVVTNDELASLCNTSDQWIAEKIGIRERRYVSPGEGTSDLATRAARLALEDAGWTAHDVEAIVVASSTSDYFVPGVGVLVQDKLHCRSIPAYDIHNSSPGFLFAMEAASGLVESGRYGKVVVIGAEVHSTSLDFSERGRLMSVIFGDGAGAVALTSEPVRTDKKLASIKTRLFSDGKQFDKLWCEAPASLYHPRISHEMIDDGRIYPQMDGRFIFEQAVARMANACQTLLSENHLTIADVNWVVPHQANLRIIETLGKQLGVSSSKVVTTIAQYGNLSSASIPVALDVARKDGRIQPGDIVLCPSFGSGFSWGAMLMEI